MRKLNKYSYEEIKSAVEKSITIANVCRELNIGVKGGNYKTMKKYIEYYNIDTSHFQTKNAHLKGKFNFKKRIPLDDILIENSKYLNNTNLKNRLFDENLKLNICEVCGIDKWNNKRLVLQLDHINGINTDNRLENLRIICPNCHSQTDTFCGKQNSKKYLKEKEKLENNGKTIAQINKSLKDRRVERPDKEQLKKLIIENGFQGTGRIYKLDGNSIKKWCEQYNMSKYIKDYK